VKLHYREIFHKDFYSKFCPLNEENSFVPLQINQTEIVLFRFLSPRSQYHAIQMLIS